jgi:hypothetical protein
VLLALKRWSRVPGAAADIARIRDGESVLLDRCCVLGGWNYGNSNMLGRELKPYVPTTAAALLSLQDRTSVPEVRRSVDYLAASATSEGSAMALSLAVLALKVLGRDASAAQTALRVRIRTTLAVGNHLNVALALAALGSEGAELAFTL